MKKKTAILIVAFFLLCLIAALISLALARPVRQTQTFNPVTKLVTDSFKPSQLDSIERVFSHAELLPEYRDVILTVLAYYPDLKDVNIRFIYGSEMTTMASRPDIKSALLGKRAYNILINDDSEFEGILLSDVPREAQIGVIAHELAHAVQYESYNYLGIIQLGLMYLDEESKSIFERETDERTISRGFGKYLKAWAQYSMHDSPKATQEYKEFKQRIYMSPQEIEAEMEKYSCYSATDSL